MNISDERIKARIDHYYDIIHGHNDYLLELRHEITCLTESLYPNRFSDEDIMKTFNKIREIAEAGIRTAIRIDALAENIIKLQALLDKGTERGNKP